MNSPQNSLERWPWRRGRRKTLFEENIMPGNNGNKMKQLRNATIAAIVLGIVGCTQAQRQADQSKQPPKPYTIQRDVLGESLESFVANNPGCKPRAGSGHSDHTKPALAGTQYCVIGGTTYAGMPLIARLADFYQGRLYSVSLEAPTSTC